MEHSKTPQTVSDFLDLVGRLKFQQATRAGTQSVTRAKFDGVFPDGWYWRTRNFCDDIGMEIPEHLFRSYEKPRKAVS